MKVSKKWLDNFFDSPLPDAQTIADALTFHAFEIDSIEGDVLDVKVTPNRGHDALSHRGIAKELSAILKIPLTKDPFARPIDLSKQTSEVSVVVEDSKLCPRYIAGLIKGVKVAPSPEWLKSSLEAIGQRSINNVVDATNLVMFNTGQPLHAFDAGRLGSLAIGVRNARPGEELEALDKKKYALTPAMLVITAADRPVGIAGIKGGMADRIDEATHDIVLESATFDGVSIRKSAQALKLRTDASARFEQVLSPELAAYGMQQAVDLIVAIAGGEVAGFVDLYPEPQKPRYVSVSLEKINAVLGTTLTGAEVADALTRLGLSYKEESNVFEVQSPPERLDLTIAEDLIEEVARIVGYDKISSTALPPVETKPEINQNFAAAEKAREELRVQGYGEVLTSVFADQGERMVLNKVDSVRPYLRTSLIPGLTEALAKNKPNKDLLGLGEIKLFEIGVVWTGGKEVTMVGTISEKQPAQEKPLVPAEAVSYGDLPVSSANRFESFSKYPYIVRDIAIWVPNGTEPVEVLTIIKKEAGELAYKVMLFDQFEKEGRVSLAYRIIFQSFERTLTEAEANAVMERVAAFLTAKGFEIR
jgi:phenylalanyl-tRNA synthetase beta chain